VLARVDDGGVVGIAHQPRKQARDGLLVGVGKGRLAPAWQQQVVGRDAGLAAVEQLAHGDLQGRAFQVGA
jgi:hypothetical protein